jgi:hypothetical protein
MAKYSTFPTIFDQALQINISKLKGWGYLKPNQSIQTNIVWSRHGERTAEISLYVNTLESNPYIQLKYNYQGEPREYKLKLFWKESNLNQGKVWFFICPKTFKYCRKLYLVEGYFLSRSAFKGLNCMYEKQTYSKYGRSLDKIFGTYYGIERAYEKIYSKHFKKFYAGKPTKKYLRIMEQIQKAERIPHHEIERALIV